MRLKNILFTVENLERSLEFYRELFGLQVLADLGGNVILSDGLVLQERRLWETAIGRPVASGGCDAVLYFEEYDLEAFRKKLGDSRFAIDFVQAPEETKGVIRLFDPDRHVIEVRENRKERWGER